MTNNGEYQLDLLAGAVPDGAAQAAQGRRIAIAVEYDAAQHDAPKVVASGKGAVAEQILRLAFENGVKVREDAPLAEILSLIEVESPIPLEAFAAVAEILSYVYRADAAQRSHRQGETGV